MLAGKRGFQVECFGWVHLPLGNEGGGMGRRVGSLSVACCMHVKLCLYVWVDRCVCVCVCVCMLGGGVLEESGFLQTALHDSHDCLLSKI